MPSRPISARYSPPKTTARSGAGRGSRRALRPSPGRAGRGRTIRTRRAGPRRRPPRPPPSPWRQTACPARYGGKAGLYQPGGVLGGDDQRTQDPDGDLAQQQAALQADARGVVSGLLFRRQLAESLAGAAAVEQPETRGEDHRGEQAVGETARRGASSAPSGGRCRRSPSSPCSPRHRNPRHRNYMMGITDGRSMDIALLAAGGYVVSLILHPYTKCRACKDTPADNTARYSPTHAVDASNARAQAANYASAPHPIGPHRPEREGAF